MNYVSQLPILPPNGPVCLNRREDVGQTWGPSTQPVVPLYEDPLLCQHILDHLDHWFSIF
jgi:hypothetical protein